jgi:hypothetical protein
MEREILIDLINQNLTQREISEQLGKSQTTIRYWLNKFSLTTTNLQKPREKLHYCHKCGETNSNNFYGNDKHICGKCHNNRVMNAGKEKRDYAIEQLGSSCKICGFNEYKCSLDIHHLDPKTKDSNFKSMRGWSIKRIDKEIQHCVLLCKNCHSAYHNGLVEL